uniref:Uncharacterized protein n=1 Tax=Ciona savignyi TaxID=51511 RepID=H2ZD49_CIOSA
MPLSLVRIEERLNFDTSLGRHPATSGFPVSTITRGQSAQGGSHPANTPTTPTNGGTITTFRLHKERQNWNYRTGDLSVNGGGYYGSTPIQPGGRAEPSSLGPLSISPASNFAHKMAATRDKSSATKTRLSSRYGSRNDGSPQSYSSSATKECPYADPCISAPPSFQQRLTELSLLESETIKYERNRKLKRKKNQDKDL